MQHDTFGDATGIPTSSALIVEAQRLFVPFLTQLLSDAGFVVTAAVESLDAYDIKKVVPALVFVDVDHIEADPFVELSRLRDALPKSILCAYTVAIEETSAESYRRAGANCIISKDAPRFEIIRGLHRAVRVGSYTDHRFMAKSNGKTTTSKPPPD